LLTQDAAPDTRPDDRIDGYAAANLSAFVRNAVVKQPELREAGRNFVRHFHRGFHRTPRRQLSKRLSLPVIWRARIRAEISFCQPELFSPATSFESV
jgi:hypothetical protein